MSTEWNREEAINFWKELYPEIDLPKEIWDELSDYYHVMNSYGKVLCHATGGQISKINTDPDVICAVIDDFVDKLVEEAIQDQIEE